MSKKKPSGPRNVFVVRAENNATLSRVQDNAGRARPIQHGNCLIVPMRILDPPRPIKHPPPRNRP